MGRIDFSDPDEVRTFPNGNWQVKHVGPSTIAFGTFQPGWKWSNDVKPVVGTDYCQHRHVGFLVSGHLHVQMDDGSEFEATPGEVYIIEPGHDAWVVGDQETLMYEFATKSAEEYAKQ